MRLGIDVGGTFTDVVLIDDRSGQIHYTKVLTTPRNPAEGVMSGIEKILADTGSTMDQVGYIVHGSTIGTNALIERKGAKTGLITTEGFRDVLEIARIERPAAGLYDMSVDLPDPLVPRYLRCEVRERVGADGQVVTPLDEGSVRQAVQYLKDEGVESIAVCLLFSFLNPAHEQRVGEICRELYPEAYVSLSSQIAPEFREYERSSTTVINAYLQPIVVRYLDSLVQQLEGQYGAVDPSTGSGQALRIMQASGGSMTVDVARVDAVHTVNSGPAGGVVASSYVGRLVGDTQLVSVDMGGTSFDIGLVDQGQPRVHSEGEFEGLPVKMPMVDVHAIGAGGGSIAWIDKGGALNVGPMSAGAAPGPACYGLGGEESTVTDANLVLGRLNPDYFLGGEMVLHPDLARRAIETRVAKPLGMSVEEAANGIIRLVNANMVKGISVSSIEKGYDVREFTLMAFGGAGALHAVELAEALDMSKVIIPPFPGTLSALGLLVSDTRHDYVQTVAISEQDAKAEALLEILQNLEARGRAQLKEERVPEDQIEVVWSADLRYEGQSYEINTPVPHNGRLTQADVQETIRRFHELHQRIYEYSSVDEPVEFINVRVTTIGRVPAVSLAAGDSQGADPAAAQRASRPVYFSGAGFVECPVYDRARLKPGNQVAGPCLVEEIASTTVLTPGARGVVDEYGNIVITL
ncbi:MAG: hydantoinase/oxoprolinase family protein [Anaerolineae bacterium]